MIMADLHFQNCVEKALNGHTCYLIFYTKFSNDFDVYTCTPTVEEFLSWIIIVMYHVKA